MPNLIHFEAKKKLTENCMRIGGTQFEEGAGVFEFI